MSDDWSDTFSGTCCSEKGSAGGGTGSVGCGDPTEGGDGVRSVSCGVCAQENAIFRDSLMQYLELNQTKKKVRVRKITSCSSSDMTCWDKVVGGVSSSLGDCV